MVGEELKEQKQLELFKPLGFTLSAKNGSLKEDKTLPEVLPLKYHKNFYDAVKEFFVKNPNSKLTVDKLAKKLSMGKARVRAIAIDLFRTKDIKVVGMEPAGPALVAVYQHIKGNSSPLKNVILEDSQNHQQLDLVSAAAYLGSKGVILNGGLYQKIKSLNITEYYILQTDNHWRKKYFKEDLNKVIEGNQAEESKVEKSLVSSAIEAPVEESLPVEQDPILLPDLQTQALFKPKDLLKKVFNLFGYKLNLNVTIEKKRTVTSSGQDLIEF